MIERKYRLVPLLILAGFTVTYIVLGRDFFFRDFPFGHSWTELMLNYQGGVMKRGLLGEIAFHLHPIISARVFISTAVVVCYVAAMAGMVLVLGIASEFSGLLFLASPAAILFPLFDYQVVFARKDVFLVAALVAGLIIITRASKNVALFAIVVIYAVVGAIIEIAWLYFPLVFAALLTRSAATLQWKVRASAFAAAITLFGLIGPMLLPSANLDQISASWIPIYPEFPLPPKGALCCVNIPLVGAFELVESHMWSHHAKALSYGFAFLLGLIPLAFLLDRRGLPRLDGITFAATAAGLATAAVPFLFGADWGRYVYLWIVHAFLFFWFACPEKDVATPKFTMAIFLILYATTWRMAHYLPGDDSAVRFFMTPAKPYSSQLQP